MKKHYRPDIYGRYLCGKHSTEFPNHSTSINETDCKTCIEVYKYNRGLINEYTCGGDFSANKKRRKHQGQWTYKEEVARLKKENLILKESLQNVKEFLTTAGYRARAQEIYKILNKGL